MAMRIASAPMKARSRMGPAPFPVGSPRTGETAATPLRPHTFPEGIEEFNPRTRQSERSAEQRDAFGDRRLFQGAIERRERQSLAYGELEIGGIVDGQFSLARKRQQVEVLPRRFQSYSHSRQFPNKLRRLGRRHPPPPLVDEALRISKKNKPRLLQINAIDSTVFFQECNQVRPVN